MKKRFYSGLILTVLAGLFFSCNVNIGLGNAVDVVPPTMDIENPPLGAIIRDDFAISGTWSDDGQVKAVTITLERTDGCGSPVEYKGKVTTDEEGKKGTWSVTVDPLSEEKPILDGQYQATIVSEDGGSHTTTVTRQFIIDNTAPVIVLQRPSAKASDTAADSYGQSFTLEGQAADDNNINLIQVEIYSDAECTNLKHTVDLYNVPNTISLDVAKFVEGNENDYSKIYGSTTKEGEKPFYCKVVAYDDAQRYPIEGNQDSDDTKGNSTSNYYLYEEIYSSVLKNYKLPEIYKMFSGTYTLTNSSRSAEDADSVKNVLAEKAINKGYFSLNPANNPTFTVSGRENLKKDGTDFTGDTNKLTTGSSLVIEITTGLDSIPLSGDTLKVYVQKCNDKGVAEGDKIYIADDQVQKEKSGSDYKMVATVVKSDDIVVGNYYLIGIEGTDEDGNEVVANGSGYGFRFASSGIAPKISSVTTKINDNEPTSSNNLYVAQYKTGTTDNTTIKVTGTVSSDDPDFTLAVALDETELDGVTITPVENENEKWTFEVSFDTSIISNPAASGQHEITISAANTTAASPVSKVVMYDAVKPSITIDDFESAPKYDPDHEDGTTIAGTYLNGTVSLQIRVEDDEDGTGISASTMPYYVIVKDGVESEKTEFSKNTGGKAVIDTTKYYGSGATGDLTLRIYAFDKAGNQAVYDSIYTVDQSTDKPYVGTPNEATLVFSAFPTKTSLSDVIDGDDASAKKNIVKQNTEMKLNLYDDDGLSRYVFKVGKWVDDSTAITMEVPAGYYDDADDKEKGKATSGTKDYVSYTPTETGYYKISIVAYDDDDTASDERTFFIVVSGSGPAVTLDNEPGYLSKSKKHKLTGFVTSINAIQKNSSDKEYITITEAWGENKTTTQEIVLDSNRKFSIELPIDSDAEGSIEYTFNGQNKLNEKLTGKTSFTVIRDITDPVIEITDPKVKAIKATSTVKIVSKVTEANYESVNVYLIKNKTDTPSADDFNESATPVKTADGVYNCTATIPNVSDGDYYIAVIAKDSYENSVTKVSDYVCTVDTTKPSVGELTSTFESFNIAAQSNSSSFKISSAVSDSGSGIASVKIYKDDVEIDSGKVTSSNNNGTYSFTIDKSVITNGSNIFKVTAKDNAGLENSAVKTIVSDIEKPTVAISGTKPTVTVSSVEYVNGKITINGTASDTTKLKEQNLKIKVTKVGDAAATDLSATTGLISEAATNSYKLGATYKSWSFVLDTTKLDDKSDYTITVQSEDAAGNLSAEDSTVIKIDQSTDKPSLSINSVDQSYTAVASLEGKSTNIIAGTGKLTGTVTDDDGIASVTIVVKDEQNTEKYNKSVLPAAKVGTTTYTIDSKLSELGMTAEGGYIITVTVVDNKKETTTVLDEDGNSDTSNYSTNNAAFAIAVDNSIPEIAISTANNSYYSSQVDITGSVKDGSGKIKLQATTLPVSTADAEKKAASKNYTNVTEVTLSSNEGTLSDTLTISDLADTALNTNGNPSSSYTVTYTATDRWGRTNSASLNFYKDSVGPTFVDSTSWVGKNDADHTTTAKVKNIWYKDSAITIGGEYTDTTSGAETIYYWLNPDGTNVKTGDTSKASGDFNAARSGTSTTYTYKSTISGFVESTSTTNNNLTIMAVDKAKNTSKTTAYVIKVDQTPPAFTSEYYKYANSTLYSSASGTLLTNKQNAITIYGNISDSASGVGELSVSVAGTNVTALTDTAKKPTITYSTTAIDSADSDAFATWVTTNDSGFGSYSTITDKTTIKSWKLVLPAADIAEGAVLVTPPDVAGNGTATQIFTFNIDTAAPTVTYTDLKDADETTDGIQVNGKIQLSGSASDTKQISEVTGVQYSIYDTTNKKWGTWTAMTASQFLDADNTSTAASTVFTTDSTPASWKTNVIDTAATPFSGTPRVKFRVVATDAAGNDSVHTYTLNNGTVTAAAADGNVQEVYVNQDTDRPRIAFTNISLSGMGQTTTGSGESAVTTTTYAYLNNTNTLYGIASDDDGISKLEYSTDYGTKGTSATWKPVTLSNGSFSIPGIAEGANEIYFRVTDTANTTQFVSSTTGGAKLTGNEENAAVKTILYLRANTKGPEISTLDFQRYDATASAYETTVVSLNNLNSSYKFGGKKYTKVKVTATVTDKNDVSSVTIGGVTATAGSDDQWTAEIPLTTYKTSGVQSFTVTAKDGASSPMSTDKNFDLTLDNTAPTMTFTSHEAGEKIKSTFTLKGTVDEAGASMKYLITSSEAQPTDWSSAKAYAVPEGETINSWDITFDGDTTNPDEFHDDDQKTYFTNLYKTAAESGTTNGIIKNAAGTIVEMCSKTDCAGNDGVAGCGADVVHDKYRTYKNFYFHFQLTDTFGNVGYNNDFNLLVDPQGDIPEVTLVTPRVEKYYWATSDGTVQKLDSSEATPEETGYTYKGTYATASGRISITGSADDDKAIKGVYMQVDPEYSAATGFTWNKDNTKLANYVSSVQEIYKDESSASVKGIYLGNGSNWTAKLNGSGEFNGANGANSFIAIRFFAVDTDGNVLIPGDTDIMIIEIDQGAPKIGYTKEFYVRQYSDNTAGTGTVTAEVKYEDGMRLTGNWWLEGSVEDESGIKTVKMNNIDVISSYCSGMTGTINEKSTSGYNVKYPVGNSVANKYGKLTYELYAIENTDIEKDNSYTFTIYYDNKAPGLSDESDSSYKIEPAVENTDGFYTFGSAITEEDGESGFARTVVYFKRGTTIYDVFLPKASSPVTSGYTEGTDGLYWKSVKVTGVTTDSSCTVLTVTAGSNVHPGGIVKFGGAIYTIKAVDDTTVTIVGLPSTSLVNTNAEFALGAVIDYTGTEGYPSGAAKITTAGYGYGYWNKFNEGCDYDCMIERTNTQGTKTIWEANINTKNIPDGPIEIHYVVFDEAGNSSHGVVAQDISSYSSAALAIQSDKAFVQNNAPKIASVTVATTVSGATTAADAEYTETYYVSEKTRKINGKEYQKSVNVSSDVTVANGSKGFMTIKDVAWVEPEIVGGNGDLSYTYKINDGTTVTPANNSLGTATVDGGEEYLNAEDQNEAKYVKGQVLTMPITLDMIKTATATDNSTLAAPTSFFFTIIDSTPGTTGLTATMDVKLAVNYHDRTAPNVVVDPFFWNSHSDNSLYQNSYKNGHIELEEVTGGNPDVSGTISIRGSAFDDHKLSSIWVKFDGFTPASGTYSGTAADSDDYYKVASYSATEGKWTSYANPDDATSPYTVAGNKWAFKVTPDYLNLAGHKADWQLDIDTSAISGAMGDGKKVYIRAIDATGDAEDAEATVVSAHTSSTSASGAATDGDDAYNKPDYEMDVVPYISEVLDANGTSANRSRLGRYPVQAGATIQLKGFNFGEGTVTVTRHVTSSGTASTTAAETLTAARTSANIITVTAPSYSGYVNLKIGDVPASNNQSSTRHGWNIVEGYDASDKTTYGATAAAAAGTNFWTDDVYLSVWKTDLPSSMSRTILPSSGFAKKINTTKIYYRKQDNGVNSTTVDANQWISMWSSPNDNQLYDWIGGNTSYGLNIGITEATFDEAPAYLDMCIIDGMPWYVTLDNYLNGASANNWGRGLFIAREGYSFAKSTSINGSNSQNKEIIEFQGKDNSRSSSSGYDSIRPQFYNPRIAGYVNSDDGYTYVYTSYYDSYAHCLKYSAHKERIVEGNFGISGKWEDNAINNVKSFSAIARTADHMTDGACVVAGYDTLVTNESNFKEEAGEWSDIAVDGTIPVIVYYNKTNKCLEIARAKSKITTTSEAPVSNNVKTSEGVYPTADGTKTAWNKTLNIKPSNVDDFGKYVSMAMDSSGNLHITAADANGVLYYGLLEKSGTTYAISSAGWQIVDSTAYALWTDIDLTASSSTLATAKPVISYLNKNELKTTSATKVAFYNGSEWEAMTDPSKYIATDQRTSALASVYEWSTTGEKDDVAVSFNGNQFTIDFLRKEQ